MAVYTKLDIAEIKQLISRYALGELVAAEGITAGVENTNYLLQLFKDGQVKKYIFTVFEKRVQPQDLPFFIGLMEHVALKGFPCPLPLPARDGSCIQEVLGKKAVIISFLEGAEVQAITPFHTALVGEALARLHAAAQGFAITRANDLSLAGWQEMYARIAPRMDDIEQGLAGEVKAELEFLAAHWPTHLPQGVIHADLFTDNVFFYKEKLSGVIDFYFACNDALMYDLAVTANAWCFDEQHQWVPARGEALFAGYNKLRLLSVPELQAFNTLARGAALRFLLTRAHDWLFRQEGAQVKIKDPLEYAKKLRFFRGIN